MRVVAGTAGGIPLSVLDGVVRPTTDKARGAIFSSLGDAVPDARVLDLFAGSGALAIEALSRGASSAVLVEQNPRAVDIIRKNLKKCRLEASVQMMDVHRFLEAYAHPGSFDLVFADPPYRKSASDTDHVSRLLGSPKLADCLSDIGTFVLEAFTSDPLPDLAGTPWQLLRSRAYGESTIHYLTVAR